MACCVSSRSQVVIERRYCCSPWFFRIYGLALRVFLIQCVNAVPVLVEMNTYLLRVMVVSLP